MPSDFKTTPSLGTDEFGAKLGEIFDVEVEHSGKGAHNPNEPAKFSQIKPQMETTQPKTSQKTGLVGLDNLTKDNLQVLKEEMSKMDYDQFLKVVSVVNEEIERRNNEIK